MAEGSDATFTVTLSKAVAKAVTVAWSAPLGTDAAGSADLGTTSGTVTFAAGSAAGATQTITIRATDDALSETAESFTVTLGAITSTLSSQISLKNGASSAQATIAQSDPITISITGPSAVDEGDATGNYTVSLSPSGVTPTSDLTVSYATSNGTATAGSDYTAKSGTLTFSRTAAGSQTFTVQTTEDTLDEGAGETFTVTISSPSGGGGPAPTLGTSSSVTTTITDDDDAPTGITLSANPNSLGEDDAATSVTVTATLNGGSTRTSATVVTIGALAGTATKDTDYTVTSLATITIPANSTSGTGALTITPTDDQIVEGDETIVVPGTTTTQVGLTVTSATITLTDDDKSTTTPGDKDSAELSITGPTANVAEGADASFTVTLSAGVASEVQVAWSTPLGTDSAEGADLGTTSGTVTFAAGSAAGATQTITIRATDDALSETAESFTVTLGAITSTLSSQISLKNGAKAATATISESDPITINISGPSTVDEGDATGSYTVSLSPSGVTPTSDLTVSYATSNGTATAGSDYTAKSGTLTFTNAAPGAQTFTVQTTEDTLDEGDRRDLHRGDLQPVGRRADRPPRLARASSERDDDDHGRRRRADRHHAERQPQQPGRGRRGDVGDGDGHLERQHLTFGHRRYHRHAGRHGDEGHRLHGDVAGQHHHPGQHLQQAPARSPSRRRTTPWWRATRRSSSPAPRPPGGPERERRHHHPHRRRQDDHDSHRRQGLGRAEHLPAPRRTWRRGATRPSPSPSRQGGRQSP